MQRQIDYMTKILALIPAFNEAQHIAQVVRSTCAHLPVLVVDDGSTDQTAAQAQKAGAQVLRQQPNQGKGAALRAGFRYALDHGYDAIVTLDADGQHDPAQVPGFVQAFDERGADLIVGTRTFAEMPLIRRIANTIGTMALSWALGQPIHDNQSGYRLIGRRLMQITLDSRESGFEFEVEMIVSCVLQDLPLDWIPIHTIYAGESSHIHPVQHTVDFFRLVWSARQRIQRAKALRNLRSDPPKA
jgi:glycosyltransferase involved in cell wall biosynthesis